MPAYLCVLAYDGTHYAGFQKQPNKHTIQQTFQETFKRVFHTDVTCIGSSRTDAGVHALGQIIQCTTSLRICPSQLMHALNNSLSADMCIRTICEVSESFNIHKNVIKKTYHYHVFTKRPTPFLARYGWYWSYPIDIAKLNQALDCFVGTHQFNAFCSADDMRTCKIRTIDTIKTTYLKRFNAYRITIVGKKFLHHMIRRLVGAAIQVASNPDFDVYSIQNALESGKAKQAFLNAPAHGLLLYKIIYAKEG